MALLSTRFSPAFQRLTDHASTKHITTSHGCVPNPTILNTPPCIHPVPHATSTTSRLCSSYVGALFASSSRDFVHFPLPYCLTPSRHVVVMHNLIHTLACCSTSPSRRMLSQQFKQVTAFCAPPYHLSHEPSCLCTGARSTKAPSHPQLSNLWSPCFPSVTASAAVTTRLCDVPSSCASMRVKSSTVTLRTM